MMTKPRPEMPPFNFGLRESLMELRPRHLLMVEEYGHTEVGYNRDALHDYFLLHWNRLFGTLRRSKAVEVPSDQLRKEVMIARLLDLIEGRQAEYREERSGIPRTSNNRGTTVYRQSKQTLRSEYRLAAKARAIDAGYTDASYITRSNNH
jgi:hypothetical protein